MWDGVHVGVNRLHVGRALRDLVDDPKMKTDFETPDGFVGVITGIREALLVTGAFSNGFHEGVLVADVELFGLVVDTDLEAVGLPESVGFASGHHQI